MIRLCSLFSVFGFSFSATDFLFRFFASIYFNSVQLTDVFLTDILYMCVFVCIIINNNNKARTMFMVLSSCWSSIARVHPGSRDECSTAPGGCWHLDQAKLPVNYTHHRHFIITQSESWYSFYRPTERRRLSRPSWLATDQDGLPTRTQSPIQVLTGPGVE